MWKVEANRQRRGRCEFEHTGTSRRQDSDTDTTHPLLVPQHPPAMATNPSFDDYVRQRIKANMASIIDNLLIRREYFHGCEQCGRHLRGNHPGGPALESRGYRNPDLAPCNQCLDVGANLRRCKSCGLAYYCVGLISLGSVPYQPFVHVVLQDTHGCRRRVDSLYRVESARNRPGRRIRPSAVALLKKPGGCSSVMEKKRSSAAYHSKSSVTGTGSL